MSQATFHAPRRKRKVYESYESPFPIHCLMIVMKDFRLCKGEIINNNVIVRRTEDIELLYGKGYFGKGILSRSRPDYSIAQDELRGRWKADSRITFPVISSIKYRHHVEWAGELLRGQSMDAASISRILGDYTRPITVPGDTEDTGTSEASSEEGRPPASPNEDRAVREGNPHYDPLSMNVCDTSDCTTPQDTGEDTHCHRHDDLISHCGCKHTAHTGPEGASVTAHAGPEGASVTAHAGPEGASVTAHAGPEGASVTAHTGPEGASVTAHAGPEGASVTAHAGPEGASVTAHTGPEGASVTAHAGPEGASVTAHAGPEGASVTAHAGPEGASVTAHAGPEGASVTAHAGPEGASVTEDLGQEYVLVEEEDLGEAGDEEDRGEVKTLRLVLRRNPFRLLEYLQLSHEEAFFLVYALGCLSITCQKEPLTIVKLWSVFSAAERDFQTRYMAYHHFRCKGWVPKVGLKYGTDLLLYRKGPPFYHASYSVIVELVDENYEGRPLRPLTWRSLSGLNRTTMNVSKELLICYLIKPPGVSEKEMSSPEGMRRFSVQEVIVNRWISSRERMEHDEL
ncbi:LOW QUALITY PROTEIN: tRNA-splicing endonuclease subunit Sen2 [Anomaloglossus baeobatrachus]